MTKDYQRTAIDTSPLAVPEQVSIAMAEIAEDMREGLLALAVGAGLQVMGELMAADGSGSCRCPRTSCSPAPRCWAGWRWNGCWPGCPPAATAWA